VRFAIEIKNRYTRKFQPKKSLEKQSFGDKISNLKQEFVSKMHKHGKYDVFREKKGLKIIIKGTAVKYDNFKTREKYQRMMIIYLIFNF
jgi:hypothetical protein